MAPEMVETPKLATTPADIWAVGAILYRLLSGKPPFGTGLVAVPNIIQAKPPATPPYFGTKSQFDNLNASLWQIILACLQKDPKARPSADKLVSLCSELCYSHSPREAGTIVSFRDGTGAWGTIRSDAGASIFFHSHSFYGSTPSEGARVSFASFPGFPKPRAFPVLPLTA